jgi:hypothetical protein
MLEEEGRSRLCGFAGVLLEWGGRLGCDRHLMPLIESSPFLELGCGSLYPIKNLSQFFQIDQPIVPQHDRQLGHTGLLFSIRQGNLCLADA